jgi:hypothetical protein
MGTWRDACRDALSEIKAEIERLKDYSGRL